MRLVVNGERREVAEGRSVAALVAEVTGTSERAGFAVAIGGEVVPRSRWDEVVLRDGDEVEIAAPFQGG